MLENKTTLHQCVSLYNQNYIEIAEAIRWCKTHLRPQIAHPGNTDFKIKSVLLQRSWGSYTRSETETAFWFNNVEDRMQFILLFG